MYYGKCNYGKSIYGKSIYSKSIMANETEPLNTFVFYKRLTAFISKLPENCKIGRQH